MTTPRTRADELLETWLAATTRPIPAFLGPSVERRRPRRTTILAVGTVAVVIVLATVAVGALLQRQSDDATSAELADSAATAIAAADGVRFKLTIATGSASDTLGLNATGMIDFAKGRFSGTADGGGGGASMLLFGGPSSGGVIIAGGLFVQTEGQPWVHVADARSPLDAFMDPSRLARAFRGVIDSSLIDPDIRFAPCGAETCRVILLTARPKSFFDAEALILGATDQVPPADFGSTTIQLLIQPSSGFPVRMDTTLKAGSTTTRVTLDLEQLAPVPSISPPID